MQVISVAIVMLIKPNVEIILDGLWKVAMNAYSGQESSVRRTRKKSVLAKKRVGCATEGRSGECGVCEIRKNPVESYGCEPENTGRSLFGRSRSPEVLC